MLCSCSVIAKRGHVSGFCCLLGKSFAVSDSLKAVKRNPGMVKGGGRREDSSCCYGSQAEVALLESKSHGSGWTHSHDVTQPG